MNSGSRNKSKSNSSGRKLRRVGTPDFFSFFFYIYCLVCTKFLIIKLLPLKLKVKKMNKEPTNKSITSSSVVGNSQLSFNEHPQNSDRGHQRPTPKVSIQTSLFDEKRESNKTLTMKSSGAGIRSMGTSDNNPTPSSPLKKMMGALGKGVGAITKGIGTGMGAITKGIGSGMGAIGKGIGSGMGAIGKGVGTFTKGVGKGINMVGKGLGPLGLGQLGWGLGMVSKGLRLDLLGRGLGAISKQGLRGLGTLSKGLGLDMLGKGLGGLGKMGLTQLGKMKDIGKVLDLKQLVKKMAFSGGNSAIMTENDKKIMVVKGHMKRADTIAAILALLCLILSYYEVFNCNFNQDDIIYINRMMISTMKL